MIIIDLFDIDFHIFTVIKFLFNLGVRFNYIYIYYTTHKGTTKVIERRVEKRTRKTTRKGKQNGTENEELVKVEARREEKWKENVETEQKEKRAGTA